MAFTHLFGRGIFVIGATHVAMIALMRWAEKNVDFRKLVEDIEEGLGSFAKEVRTNSDQVKSEIETLLEELNKLKGLETNELVDLEDVTKIIGELLKAYRALPELMRRSIKQCIDVEETLKSIMKKAYSVQGWALIGTKPSEEQTLNSYLAQQYKGLYFIGCAEERVSLNDRSEIIINLSHFHRQLGRGVDMLVVEWIEKSGVDMPPLERVLSVVPEINENDVMGHEFIAFALGEDVDVDFEKVFKMSA